MAGVVVYMQVRSYLHGEAFREKISKKVSVLVGANGEFGAFSWSGLHGENEGFHAASDGALVKLSGNQIALDVTTNFLTRDSWEITDVRIGQGRAVLDLRKPFTKLDPLPKDEGWLASMLPQSAKLHNADIASASAEVRTRGGNYTVNGVQISLKHNSEGYWAELAGGSVELPLSLLPSATLKSGKLRYLNDRLQIDQLLLDVYGSGELDLYGEVDFSQGGGYKLSGRLEGLQCGDVVNEDWKKKLSGDLAAIFHIKPQDGLEPLIEGRITINNGELTALPVLDHIASFTMEREFRCLKISSFECRFKKHGTLLVLSDIKLQSDRLIRIEGDLEIRGEKLSGKFQVGLNPGTLSHIPGAEEKVFLPGKDAMGWATVNIGGTLSDVEEDLSARLIEAAGERMFELVGGKQALKLGGETLQNLTGIKLPVLGGEEENEDESEEKGGNLIDQGKGILDEVTAPAKVGKDVIGQGLQGILGGNPEPEQEPEQDEERKGER